MLMPHFSGQCAARSIRTLCNLNHRVGTDQACSLRVLAAQPSIPMTEKMGRIAPINKVQRRRPAYRGNKTPYNGVSQVGFPAALCRGSAILGCPAKYPASPVKLEPEALARHQKFDILFDFGNGREIRLPQLLVNFRQSRLFELCPFANARFDLLA